VLPGVINALARCGAASAVLDQHHADAEKRHNGPPQQHGGPYLRR
jgi:hypothetical protein